MTKLEALTRRWDDANRLASSTARIALAPQVAKLQELKQEAATLPVNECTKKAVT